VASIGGDTNLTSNAEYRIPIAGPVTFSLFDDFGIDTAFNKGQLKQSVEGFASLTSALYGCPVVNNGACLDGIQGSQVGFQRDIHPIARHQLRSAYVHRRRDRGHHAGDQRALPPLLRLQPAAA
jgi:outer membrane protein insertion porin family